MSNKSEKDTLVSDQRINEMWNDDMFELGERRQDGYVLPEEQTSFEDGYRFGIKQVRAIYEPELTKLRSERDELVGVMEGIMELRYSSRIDQALDEAAEVLAKHKPE